MGLAHEQPIRSSYSSKLKRLCGADIEQYTRHEDRRRALGKQQKQANDEEKTQNIALTNSKLVVKSSMLPGGWLRLGAGGLYTHGR
jgi:hypothetical protein